MTACMLAIGLIDVIGGGGETYSDAAGKCLTVFVALFIAGSTIVRSAPLVFPKAPCHLLIFTDRFPTRTGSRRRWLGIRRRGGFASAPRKDGHSRYSGQRHPGSRLDLGSALHPRRRPGKPRPQGGCVTLPFSFSAVLVLTCRLSQASSSSPSASSAASLSSSSFPTSPAVRLPRSTSSSLVAFRLVVSPRLRRLATTAPTSLARSYTRMLA